MRNFLIKRSGNGTVGQQLEQRVGPWRPQVPEGPRAEKGYQAGHMVMSQCLSCRGMESRGYGSQGEDPGGEIMLTPDS